MAKVKNPIFGSGRINNLIYAKRKGQTDGMTHNVRFDRKIKFGKCTCDDPNCAKCLSVNCQDKNCPVHTKERKELWRRNWEKANKKSFPFPKNY